MEFKVIDKELNARFQEILHRIRRLQSGGTIDSLKTVGANTDHQIGASYVSLKQLATKYEADPDLALLLWDTGRREEQIVACFLFPIDMNKEKITQLTHHCLNHEIAGYVGSLYLCRHPQLMELAEEWLASENPFHQLAALTALARHLILYKADRRVPKTFFQAAINRQYNDKYVQMTAERYRFNL